MNVAVGDRIKRLREKRDWSQLELAERVGINNSVLSRIEAGKRKARADELDKIASTLNVTSEYLLGRDSFVSKVKSGEGIKEQTAATEAHELFHLLSQDGITLEGKILTAEDRKRIKEMIHIMFPNEKDAD
ncbi:hypothetical protein BK133_01010 [Paenibacillus sp. FSL H8-0548]|uniref:helix-turn-helix domain-containing protein n=1 Tax=Paenibacillus sp. FSL H8-0548 TaxID=1920422 RepID=UPI00096EACEB|nr:helix-turn-helix transcriptional regulator [Paenibacillus sp. FSL H8-0548]OMF38814.1 hypothetical protein BK133_01010 [Paenibacillus sp. FSL H8-0548]